MQRFCSLLIVGALSSLAIAGCSQTQAPSATTTAPTQSTTQTQAPGFEGLKAVVSSTRADVQAGNFAQAQADFGKFEENWSQVENGVKARSRETYDAIENGADQVNQGLKSTPPNSEKVLTALQTLDTSIQSVAN